MAQATCLFWSKSYEATSIADLIKAMGLGSPSLYAAFGSKEALYAGALRHFTSRTRFFPKANAGRTEWIGKWIHHHRWPADPMGKNE
ncbi:TetR/AcrR family transcriptional regulator [Halotalea alkalilenta]|uniref:TetR/AcrR family transcriptional regulator n=1 Tax=Halotalea alkalilenta TaxID=376489 RepID=UPI001CBCA048|nr:TetR/AcrR family transcriptional regulator [Halotalea alkalilenta]